MYVLIANLPKFLDLKQYLPKEERASLNFNDNYRKRVASSYLNLAKSMMGQRRIL